MIAVLYRPGEKKKEPLTNRAKEEKVQMHWNKRKTWK